jgi:hypothetical protein
LLITQSAIFGSSFAGIAVTVASLLMSAVLTAAESIGDELDNPLGLLFAGLGVFGVLGVAGVAVISPPWWEQAPGSPPEWDHMPSRHWTIDPCPFSKFGMQERVLQNGSVGGGFGVAVRVITWVTVRATGVDDEPAEQPATAISQATQTSLNPVRCVPSIALRAKA